MKKLLPVLLLLVFLCACGEKQDPAAHVYSHRGACKDATEHTLRAYDLAVEYGSRFLEQDVVLSADGTLFVSHDLSALRLTGVDRLYGEMTDDEIAALRTTDGQRILSLGEVFDRYERVNFVVELKTADAAEAFLTLIEEKAVTGRVLAQSNDPAVLEKLEETVPEMKKLLLLGGQQAFEAALECTAADVLAVDKILMTAENLTAAHKAGKEFNVWTLNTEEELQKAIGMGVDTYFTNDTALALRLEQKRK